MPERFSYQWTRITRLAPALFLFILPIAHSTALRFLCLSLALATVAWNWKSWRGLPLPKRSVCIAIMFWLVVCLLATFHSIEPEYSWGEFRNEVLYTLLSFSVFYVLTDSVAAWRCWRGALLASSIAIAILAIGFFLKNHEWLRESLVGDRNAYSTYVVLSFPFLLLLAALKKETSRKFQAAVALALLLAVVSGAMTLNRNMWFGMLAQIVVFALLFLRRADPAQRSFKALRGYGWMTIVALLLFSALFVLINREKLNHQLQPKVDTAEQLQRTFTKDPRLEIWTYAIAHIRQHPWLGHGYGRGILRKDFRTHFGDPLKWHGHNVVLNYAMEAGVLGALAIIGLFATLAYQCWVLYRHADKRIWSFGVWGLAMLVGLCIKMMTDDILIRDSALLFWSLLGMMWGYAAHIERERHDPQGLASMRASGETLAHG